MATPPSAAPRRPRSQCRQCATWSARDSSGAAFTSAVYPARAVPATGDERRASPHLGTPPVRGRGPPSDDAPTGRASLGVGTSPCVLSTKPISTGRVSPRTVDLRSDVSDTLPGVAIAVPLVISGRRCAASTLTTDHVASIAREWASPAGWEVVSAEYRDGAIVVRADGPEPVPSATRLRGLLDARDERGTPVRLELVPVQRVDLPGRRARSAGGSQRSRGPSTMWSTTCSSRSARSAPRCPQRTPVSRLHITRVRAGMMPA